MTRYRVRVNVWVAVEATNAKSAKAIAENAVRHSVAVTYREEADAIRPRFASGWELFSFQAMGKVERLDDEHV